MFNYPEYDLHAGCPNFTVYLSAHHPPEAPCWPWDKVQVLLPASLVSLVTIPHQKTWPPAPHGLRSFVPALISAEHTPSALTQPSGCNSGVTLMLTPPVSKPCPTPNSQLFENGVASNPVQAGPRLRAQSLLLAKWRSLCICLGAGAAAAETPGLQSQFHCFLAAWPQANVLTPLSSSCFSSVKPFPGLLQGFKWAPARPGSG